MNQNIRILYFMAILLSVVIIDMGTVSGIDTTPPSLISSSPANGEINIPVDYRKISFTFNEPMKTGYSADWSGLGDGTEIDSYWSYDQKTINFTFSKNFPANSQVEWTLNPSGEGEWFRDLADNHLPANAYSGSFFTGEKVQISFDPKVDGYNFENWKFSENELEEIRIYTEYLFNPFNLPKFIDTPINSLLYLFLIQDGHCYGMALTSSLYYTGTISKPISYVDDDTYKIPKEDAHPNIDIYHIRQGLENIWYQFKMNRFYSAEDEFNIIKNSIKIEEEPILLSMWDQSRRIGHTVTVIGYDESDSNIKSVYVYENMLIGKETKVEFDLSQNRINYYDPDGDDTGLYYGFARYPNAYIDDLTKKQILDTYESLKSYLEINSKTLLSIKCPVNAIITDQFGRKIGYLNGEFINEIPDATSLIFEDVEIYYLPSNLDYQIRLEAFDEGSMDLSIVDKDFTLVYDKVPITDRTNGYLFLPSENINLILELDNDGDGIIDVHLIPTSYEIEGNIPATIDINPDTLNLKSNGEWITAYIELPDGSDISNINVSTINLTNASGEIIASIDSSAPVSIGDYDFDGIPDLMVKFNKSTVTTHLEETFVIEEETRINHFVELKVIGELEVGIPFKGTDTIRMIKKGK